MWMSGSAMSTSPCGPTTVTVVPAQRVPLPTNRDSDPADVWERDVGEEGDVHPAAAYVWTTATSDARVSKSYGAGICTITPSAPASAYWTMLRRRSAGPPASRYGSSRQTGSS